MIYSAVVLLWLGSFGMIATGACAVFGAGSGLMAHWLCNQNFDYKVS